MLRQILGLARLLSGHPRLSSDLGTQFLEARFDDITEKRVSRDVGYYISPVLMGQ